MVDSYQSVKTRIRKFDVFTERDAPSFHDRGLPPIQRTQSALSAFKRTDYISIQMVGLLAGVGWCLTMFRAG